MKMMENNVDTDSRPMTRMVCLSTRRSTRGAHASSIPHPQLTVEVIVEVVVTQLNSPSLEEELVVVVAVLVVEVLEVCSSSRSRRRSISSGTYSISIQQ